MFSLFIRRLSLSISTIIIPSHYSINSNNNNIPHVYKVNTMNEVRGENEVSEVNEVRGENEVNEVRNKNFNYDVAVIGGGIIGLSVARECASRYKCSVVLLEKEDTIGAGV
jgi:NADPH-dependent 2,4-dienoyl-CoA reductase/sulfur reductase-like enzyme